MRAVRVELSVVSGAGFLNLNHPPTVRFRPVQLARSVARTTAATMRMLRKRPARPTVIPVFWTPEGRRSRRGVAGFIREVEVGGGSKVASPSGYHPAGKKIRCHAGFRLPRRLAESTSTGAAESGR